jgi:hypothetical protein
MPCSPVSDVDPHNLQQAYLVELVDRARQIAPTNTQTPPTGRDLSMRKRVTVAKVVGICMGHSRSEHSRTPLHIPWVMGDDYYFLFPAYFYADFLCRAKGFIPEDHRVFQNAIPPVWDQLLMLTMPRGLFPGYAA